MAVVTVRFVLSAISYHVSVLGIIPSALLGAISPVAAFLWLVLTVALVTIPASQHHRAGRLETAMTVAFPVAIIATGFLTHVIGA
ncbi:MAG: hypothetical protein HIU81_13355 [Acidobacteria bacterium]|nr:hypothetical protein [Acidobacteriota bacterium]